MKKDIIVLFFFFFLVHISKYDLETVVSSQLVTILLCRGYLAIYRDTFMVTAWERKILAFGLKMLLNILLCTEQPPQPRLLAQM